MFETFTLVTVSLTTVTLNVVVNGDDEVGNEPVYATVTVFCPAVVLENPLSE